MISFRNFAGLPGQMFTCKVRSICWKPTLPSAAHGWMQSTPFGVVVLKKSYNGGIVMAQKESRFEQGIKHIKNKIKMFFKMNVNELPVFLNRKFNFIYLLT